MVTVEHKGEYFKVSPSTAKTLKEVGFIRENNDNRSLFHPTGDRDINAIKFFANAVHEEVNQIAVGSSHKNLIDHDKTLFG